MPAPVAVPVAAPVVVASAAASVPVPVASIFLGIIFTYYGP